mmetsp:Transcript_136618/g.436523  ORF Transcript_136618/g.436523 Transcript_136618/m.436523 type:complete len:83 (-) Transcript_136618:14-262(-)
MTTPTFKVLFEQEAGEATKANIKMPSTVARGAVSLVVNTRAQPASPRRLCWLPPIAGQWGTTLDLGAGAWGGWDPRACASEA